MIDLMERLRNGCIHLKTSNPWGEQVDEIKTDSLLDEAADEIERLAVELEAIKKLERDRWTGWAKELGWTPATRMIVCQKCGNKRCPRAGDEKYKCTGSNATGQIGEMEAADEPRSFDESYLAIRAAGGDAWDGLDVSKELAEIRGHEAADQATESKGDE